MFIFKKLIIILKVIYDLLVNNDYLISEPETIFEVSICCWKVFNEQIYISSFTPL